MVELSGFNAFKVTLMVMLFYGVSITIIAYTIPSGAASYSQSLTEGVSDSNLDYVSISEEVQSSLTQQKNIPLIDVGSLVFYSGNILLDLFLNFLGAIPQLLIAFINSILTLFGGGLSAQFMEIILGFGTAAIGIFYVIQIMEIIIGVRSGRIV